MGVEGEAQHFNTDVNFATGPQFTDARPGVPALLADLARTRSALSAARVRVGGDPARSG